MNREFSKIQQQDIEDCKHKYYQGDAIMLFEAIRRCGHYGLPIPEWAFEALTKGLNRYYSAEVRTFDEAFGVVRPPNMKLSAANTKFRYGWKIYCTVNRLHNDGVPIDGTLIIFREAVKELNLPMSPSRVKDIYYEVRSEVKNLSD